MKYIFSSFDAFPSAKGAATHIAYSIKGMAKCFGSAALICLGGTGYPIAQREGAIEIRRSPASHPNFLRRTEYFSGFVHRILDQSDSTPELIHFRDIWSGIPLLSHPLSKDAKVVFEINGLPSVELPYRYPALLQNKRLFNHIRETEDQLLDRADRVLTVSRVTAQYLNRRGVNTDRISVIPNAAIVDDNTPAWTERKPRLLYVGTLSPWQGVETLIDAMGLIRTETDMNLVIAAATRKHLKPILKQIRKRGLDERVSIRIALDRTEIRRLYRSARASVAPLSRCDRNELQGCSPIKILESMGQGTPVIAAGLPVCEEIITPGHDGVFFTPDTPRSLANAILKVNASAKEMEELSRNAKQTVKDRFSNFHFYDRLRAFYTNV